MLKKLLFCGLLAAAGGAFAAGPVDGVHQCTAQALGKTATLYMMVMTKEGGETVYIPINPTATAGNWGYGVGSITNGVLSGKDESGGLFSLTIVGASFSGTLSATSPTGPITVNVACLKYW